MRICPKCGLTYGDDVEVCTRDGGLLSGPESIASGPTVAGEVPAGEHDPLLGTHVGNYQLARKLGQGGMGSVYLAKQTQIGRQVAVKVLSADLSDSTEAVNRFFNEAKAANAIRNDHILDVLDFGKTADGRQCMVMELLEGASLEAHVTAGPMPEVRILFIAAQAAAALHAAHERGIVHRDLKPDNVFLITRSGTPDFVKLVDFGIAKLADPELRGGVKTRSGAVIGTPYYMSPEQASGGDITASSDIYSFGVMLYQMATGRVPFTGATFSQVLRKHMVADPPDPRSIRGDVSPELSALILRCLRKDPADRYRNMRGLSSDLVQLLRIRGGEDAARAAAGVPVEAAEGVHTPVIVAATPAPPTAQSAPVAIAESGPTTLSMGAGEAPVAQAPPAGRSRMLLAVGVFAVLGIIGAAAGLMAFGGDDASVKDDDTADDDSSGVREDDRVVSDPDPRTSATAAPVTRRIRVDTDPPGAEVKIDHVALGPAPLDVDVRAGESVVVTATLGGYEVATSTIDGSTEGPVMLALRALPKKGRGKGKRGDKAPSTSGPATVKPATAKSFTLKPVTAAPTPKTAAPADDGPSLF